MSGLHWYWSLSHHLPSFAAVGAIVGLIVAHDQLRSRNYKSSIGAASVALGCLVASFIYLAKWMA